MATNFKRKNWLQKLLLSQQELNEYYRALRKYEFDQNAPVQDKSYYEKRYRIARSVIKFYMNLLGRPMIIHKDLRTFNSDRPKIYATTHIGRYDIEASIVTKNEQAVYLWGDPGKLYRSPEKILIDLIGANFVDTDHRDDCHIGLENMIKLARNHINNYINPEGAWNLSPNKVVMRLYDGAIIAAIKGNADIVPCAIQQYGKKIYVSYGKEIDLSDVPLSDVKEAKAQLRDEMATLAWELVREYSGKAHEIMIDGEKHIYTCKRVSLGSTAYEEFIHSIMKDTENDYDIGEIEATRYKSEKYKEPADVFNPLEENRILSDNNSFMLADTDRFINYMDVLKRVPDIEEELKMYHKSIGEIEPAYIRLKKQRN